MEFYKLYTPTMGPQNHEKNWFWLPKNKGITVKTSKHIGFGGPWYKWPKKMGTWGWNPSVYLT